MRKTESLNRSYGGYPVRFILGVLLAIGLFACTQTATTNELVEASDSHFVNHGSYSPSHGWVVNVTCNTETGDMIYTVIGGSGSGISVVHEGCR